MPTLNIRFNGASANAGLAAAYLRMFCPEEENKSLEPADVLS